MTDFTITYSNSTVQTIKAYSVEFEPGFVLFYDGHETRAIKDGTIVEIKWGVKQ